MINNKQKHANKKRVGLYLGLGLGLAAIVAGSTAGAVVALNKQKDIPSNKVKLNAGSGHIFSTNQSSVLVNCKGTKTLGDIAGNLKLCDSENPQKTISDFVGWAYTSDFKNGKVAIDKIISADAKIKEQSSLTAVYKVSVEEEGISWKTVSFERGSSAANADITGNTKFNIISGTSLREINCPVCTPKVAGEMKFVDWKKLGDTTAFGRNTPITTDTKFEPILSAAAKITFVPATGSSIVGSDTITVPEGTKFSEINSPVVECDSADNIFYGWYENAACTIPFSGDKQITSDNVKAYAKIVSKTDPNITIVSADTTQSGIVYEGNTTFAITRKAIWSSYNRPIPKAENKKLSYWQYQISGSTDWKTAEPNTSFGEVGNVTIKPVFDSTISGVTITSDFSTVAKNNPTKISAIVLPSTVGQTVTWKLFSDSSCETEVTTGASIDENGILTVTDSYTEDTIYVEATSTIDTTKKGHKGFEFANPYVESTQFWTLNTDASSGYDLGWYRLENLCDASGTTKIELWKEGQSAATKSIDRDQFDQKIYVGNKVNYIPSNFLYGCSKFNSDIEFTGVTNDDYSIRIGDNFLYGASLFNKTLNLSKCVSVGSYFLYGANAFAQPLVLTNICSIGDYFLNLATYNQTITLGEYIEKIGNGFLQGAKAYNKNITLPASITSIGSQFMFECDNFASTDENTGTITANCLLSAFDPNVENLSSKDPDAAIYKTGFKVAGSLANTFPYRTINGTLGGYYRKNLTTKAITGVTVKTSGQQTEFKVNEQFKTTGLVLTVTFDDLTTQDVTSGWSSSPYAENYTFKTTDVGDGKEITITYGGYSITYNINVKEAETDPKKLPEYLEAVVQEDETIFIKVKDGESSNVPEVLTINASYKCDDDVERNVTGISEKGFYNCTTLGNIKLPTGMLTLGDQAFEGCQGLKSVTLPSTLSTIGIGVFAGCENLASIDLPSSLQRIEDDAFNGSGVVEFTIPTNVVYIGNKALNPEKITSLTFTDTTSTWTYGESQTFVPDTSERAAQMNADSYKNVILASPMTKNESGLPEYLDYEDDPTGETDGVYIKLRAGKTIPTQTLTIQSEYVIGGSTRTVVGISEDGFKEVEGCKTVNFPNTLKVISDGAFNSSEFLSFNIPSSVTTIGENSLATKDLTGIAFDDAPSTWNYTDSKSQVQSHTFTSESSDNAAAYRETLHSYSLTKQSEVENLPDWFIVNPTTEGGTNYSISANPSYIETFPSELIINSKYKLTDGKIATITEIANDGFTDRGIATVVLPETLTSIGTNAFANNQPLVSVTIPTSVTTIGANAFYTKGGEQLEPVLKSLTFSGGVSKWKYTDQEQGAEATYESSTDAEQNASAYNTILHESDLTKVEEESDLPEYFVLNETGRDTGEYTLTLNPEYDPTTQGEIPQALEIKSTYTVDGEKMKVVDVEGFNIKTLISNITKITIDNGIFAIGGGCFSDIATLAEITIPESVTQIGPNAINTNKLETLNISASHWHSEGVSQADFLFTGDSAADLQMYKNYADNTLSKTDLPSYLNVYVENGITYIKLANPVTEESPYTGPKSLTLRDSYYVDNELMTPTVIPDNAFEDAGLTSIVLSSQVTSIGSKAFAGCVFSTITIPASVTEIYPDAIPSTVETMIFEDTEHSWVNDGGEAFTPTNDYEQNAGDFKNITNQGMPLRKNS